jgi:hypothetical protein
VDDVRDRLLDAAVASYVENVLRAAPARAGLAGRARMVSDLLS